MFAMKKILLLVALSFGNCFAGDLLLDETGTYSGMLDRGIRTTRTGAIDGMVSRNRSWVSDRSGRFDGFITRDGTVFDSRGRFSGLTDRLKDVE
jgi:hypothetical protein